MDIIVATDWLWEFRRRGGIRQAWFSSSLCFDRPAVRCSSADQGIARPWICPQRPASSSSAEASSGAIGTSAA